MNQVAGAAMLLATALAPAGAPPPEERVMLAQVIIRERVIVRVPVRNAETPRPVEWRERRTGKCVPLASVSGAAVTEGDSVDLVLRGGKRVRAKLERDCPALDFYQGFYISRSPDGLICAERDSIHARSGGECQIDRFRKLEPKE